jgi:hypothetical protein
MALYLVNFNTHSGMTVPLGEYDDLKDARQRAISRIKYFKRLYPCCDVSNNFRRGRGVNAEYEFTDCGAHLISDLHGFLTIRRVFDAAPICRHCGKTGPECGCKPAGEFE